MEIALLTYIHKKIQEPIRIPARRCTVVPSNFKSYCKGNVFSLFCKKDFSTSLEMTKG